MAWEQLTGFVKEAEQIDREDATRAPTSCAVCATALRDAGNGKLHCPWDGLVWPDDATAWGPFPGSY